MKPASAVLLIVGLFAVAVPVRADDGEQYDRILRRNHIAPNPQGVLNYIKPFSAGKLASLIRQLGDADYHKRRQATILLGSLPQIPFTSLRQASRSRDAEVRCRAKIILSVRKLRDNSEILYAALMKMQGPEYRSGVSSLLQIIPELPQKRLIAAAGDALRRISTEKDLKVLRAAIKGKSTVLRIAALGALTNILKEKSRPEVRPLLTDSQERLRLAAAGFLVRLQDRQALSVLCDLLDSKDLTIRANSFRLLRSATGKRFGYLAYDTSLSRRQSLKRWRNWLKTEGTSVRLRLRVRRRNHSAFFSFSAVLHKRLAAHETTIYGVAFSPDEKIVASCSGDRTIKLWDVVTGELRRTLSGHATTVRSVVFSPDGKLLASGSYDSTIRFWDAKTGKLIRILRGHKGSVRIIAFSPDGKRFASTSSDSSVIIWNVSTGRVIHTLKGHSSSTRSVAFSRDGRLIASCSSDRTIKLWNARSGVLRATFTGHTSSVRSVAFLPDGRTLVSCSLDRTIRLWDLDTGKVRAVLNGHTSSVKAVTVFPDGGLIASAGNDNVVRIWNTDTHREMSVLRGHTSAVWHTAFSPSGNYLASCGSDGSVRIWRIRR